MSGEPTAARINSGLTCQSPLNGLSRSRIKNNINETAPAKDAVIAATGQNCSAPKMYIDPIVPAAPESSSSQRRMGSRIRPECNRSARASPNSLNRDTASLNKTSSRAVAGSIAVSASQVCSSSYCAFGLERPVASNGHSLSATSLA